jgi:hypothetical protein
MRNTVLVQKVNFVVSVLFILAFGLVATSVTLEVAHLDDPITGVTASVGQADQLQ